MQKKLAWILLATAAPAFAHEGHGLGSGSHWHASDVWGYIALAAVLAITWWAGRRK